jgi:iron complex outermembrane receptor protein
MATSIRTVEAQAPPGATLHGTVALHSVETSPLHHATVTIPRLRLATETDSEGRYTFKSVPPGEYDVLAHMHGMVDQKKTVSLKAGADVLLDFELQLSVVHEQITVTASGREQTALETFQAVTTIEALELSAKAASSLGEVLDDQPGIAKRSFGPGTTRPVIRGFDGDRVLVLQDGMRTGTVSSQSGDHGEPIDPGSVDSVEVVKGPAALLYGSNAVGGVVNIISGHHQVHGHPHEGVRGYITGNGGSNNGYGGGSGGVEYGAGAWLFSADGGAQRTGDYSTPLGEVRNSHTRLENVLVGGGRYGERTTFNLNYGVQDGRYGVPFAGELEGGGEDIDLAFRRQNLRFNLGRKKPAAGLESFDLALAYTDWMHKELAGAEVGTQFFNKQFIYRGTFEQKPVSRLSGRFGFWGMVRDYEARGEESLSPPVDQKGFALFGVEEVPLGSLRVQFGGRLEHTQYAAAGAADRSFTGFSGAVGMNRPLWKGGAVAVNYTHSFRAPALEELYNFGPHIGNLTFEIGDTSLGGERGNGLDVSVRHRTNRVYAEVNGFYYGLDNFVFLAPTGAIEDGLIEARYAQADSRYVGAEAHVDVSLRQWLWLNLGFDAVDAQLRSGTPLPRIPPVRGRIGLDFRHSSFTVRPSLTLANAQPQIFPTETRTAGYGLLNLEASYNRASRHALHVVSVTLFNAGNQLYRNHLSLIKDLAPEIGRGVRVTYTVRFF